MPLASSKSFQPYIPVKPSTPAAPPAAPKPSLKVRQHLLSVPFEMRPLALAAGATYNPTVKSFAYRGDRLPEALLPFASQPYSWERFKEDEVNGFETACHGATRTIELRSHQDEAVSAIMKAYDAERCGFLLADDVGLGKTIEAWQAVLRMEDVETVLIVCPLAVVAHWRRTIQWMGDAGKRIVVINYDRLAKLVDAPKTITVGKGKKRVTKKVRKQKGVARYGTANEFDLVVFDESHRLRNNDTARSKLAAKISAASDFRLWLSATAGQNPLELSYLAMLISERTGARVTTGSDWPAWCEKHGLGVVKGKWRGHSSSPAMRDAAEADLEAMRAMLFDGDIPAGIRRIPEDIAGWPSINRILLPVDLDAADRHLYMQAWHDFRHEVGLAPKGSRNSQLDLVARLRFRQKASLLRTGPTVEMALEMLSQGKQVAISVAFRETMEVIYQALDGAGHVVAQIHGDLGAAEKEHQRLDFQHGRATVVLYTVEEGISLHANETPGMSSTPRVNLIHDLRWSAIAMKQIEGRCQRDGQDAPTYWLVGADTIEEEIAEIVASRLRSMSKMQGDTGTVESIEKLIWSSVSDERPAFAMA